MLLLSRVILPVNDLEKAAAFYGTLFDLQGERVSPGRYYFDCGKVTLACYDPRADGAEFDARPNPDHAYFAVENLEEVFARAQKLPCQELDTEIATRPWGERSFYAKDPFGNPLCIVDSSTIFTGLEGEEPPEGCV
jgi:predicted enzyme related to lactoylglutathione lyase